MSTPISTLRICTGVPLNNSYEHTLYFETPEDQLAYFNSKMVRNFTNFSFLRPENAIKVMGDFAEAYSWNYLMFNNGGKMFYHFINSVEYVNDNTVLLHIELDVMQTFQFDWELHNCLIERTHTKTDNFGEHTIPEGLETGPLVQASSYEVDLNDCAIMILAPGSAFGGQMYGGVYSGLNVYAVAPAMVSKLNAWFQKDALNAESIVAMWMYPKDLLIIDGDWNAEPYPDFPLHYVKNARTVNVNNIADPFYNKATLNGVPVRNMKTFCYPNTIVYASNHMGGSAIYHREWFNTPGKFSFKLYGAVSPDGGVTMAPVGYKSDNDIFTPNYEETISLPAFPSCAWASDTYKVWLAQNMATQTEAIRQAHTSGALSLIGGIAGVVGGAFTGSVTTMAGGATLALNGLNSSSNTIRSIMAQREDMKVQPDQGRGQHSASVNMTSGKMGFSLHFMCITPEYIQTIDDYFTRFGYQVNTFAYPSIRNREAFTYIKTAGAFVTGNLGTDNQRKIQAIFDNGITFWVNPDDVGQYGISNDPI